MGKQKASYFILRTYIFSQKKNCPEIRGRKLFLEKNDCKFFIHVLLNWPDYQVLRLGRPRPAEAVGCRYLTLLPFFLKLILFSFISRKEGVGEWCLVLDQGFEFYRIIPPPYKKMFPPQYAIVWCVFRGKFAKLGKMTDF